MSLQIRILGSGTSTGVPVLGCSCHVCSHKDPRYKRTRSSILLKPANAEPILIDTSPEMRLQLLSAEIGVLKHVLYTHTHADHCHGFDDLRAFLFRDRSAIQVYLAREHAAELRSRFSYAFEDTGYLGSKPVVDLHEFTQGDHISVAGQNIETLGLQHGNVRTSAFRMGSFGYATDFKSFSDQDLACWRGKISTLVASGIHFNSHPTHSVIPETVQLMLDLQVERGYITHLSHDVDARRDSAQLPAHIQFAWDGLEIEVDS